MMMRLPLVVIPVLVSVFLHGLLIWAVIHRWQQPPKPPEFKQPEFVQTRLVELKAKAPEKKAPPKQVNKVDLTAQKKREAAERKRREQEAAKQKAIAEKKAADAKRKQKEVEERKLAEQKAEREKKAAADRKAKELERKRQQEALEKALRDEERMLAEQAEAEVVNSYKSIIMERIAQRWSRPPSARRGMMCDLVIQLVPTGKIITVNITKSSGNDAFDRSAEQAVRAVDSIPELKDVEIAVFERNFRTIHLRFNPEDLRL